ncbi:MAG: hypothetical protein RMZ41_030695 [Nostoc sp. DedVER02]|uniref:hypothetical protein n=1 Tax=unclassified Nostoc TaxID=2593658 RepID=UPI002AD1F70E|nr:MULTISPECIES: hypothetical protein [unclassified Nostoc]MDZ7984433.1 hypothetical protein [Nostoc sp. DedVER02]MDZ8110764.1 hypothetical protein [Nostoc sp. DedVER01b]
MIKQVEGKKDSKSQRSQRRLYVGTFLTTITLFLVYLIATDSFQKSDAARYVASFVAGLFGFTAIETLRRSLD